jgi:DNA-binding NarL/FixJ family response regulator
MRLTPLRMVVVDDHAVVRRGVRALLESRTDWEIVAEATTGREALDAVKRHRPEIVVMGISLPDLNGLEATRQIVRESPQTEVLVLTMHHSEELAREVLKAGARGYVLKSDADESLITAVDALRQHKPFLTSGVTEFMLDGFLRDMSVPDLSTRDSVTPREREIIQLLTEGLSNKEAAARLGISVKTIEAHRANIMRKLRLRSVTDLVRYAIRNKIARP